MALLYMQGFDQENLSTGITGYNQTNNLTIVSSPVHGGGAFSTRAARCQDGTSCFGDWRRNRSAARSVRVREVCLNLAFHPTSLIFNSQPIGVAVGASGQCSFRHVVSSLFEFTRAARTPVASGVSAPFVAGEYITFRIKWFIDNVNGTAQAYIGDEGTPFINLTGVNTRGLVQDYADRFAIGNQANFSTLIFYVDDLIYYAPSVILDVGGGSLSTGDNLSIGGATMVVSDVDTNPDEVPTASPSGSYVRVWVHSWNGVTFANGASASGGSLSSTTAVVPNVAYQGGFEPWSWPQYTRSNGIYVLSRRFTAQGTVNLSPTGSATNWQNVDDVPYDDTTFNEATSGTNESDTYTTLSALPAGIQSIEGIQVTAACQTFSTYLDVDIELTDGAGSQSTRQSLPSVPYTRYLFAARDSAGNAWGTTLPSGATIELRV